MGREAMRAVVSIVKPATILRRQRKALAHRRGRERQMAIPWNMLPYREEGSYNGGRQRYTHGWEAQGDVMRRMACMLMACRKMATVAWAVVPAVLLLSGCLDAARPERALRTIPMRTLPARRSMTRKKAGYHLSEMCKGCHTSIHEQQSRSMHARSYVNPIFQAQYFREVLPQAYGDPRLFQEARSCAACHMPVAYQMSGGKLVTGKHVDPQMSGVTCDLCHRISGYSGKEPQNGNFIASPGEEKYGPFRCATNWHHVYLEFQTKSEFCATCHESVNQLGVRVKPTYTEWQASPHAKKGIQCQDCHMNAKGYLIDSKAEYDSGKAAIMTTVGSAPERAKLYSHRFPGARTQTQLHNAIPLRIRTDKTRIAPGDNVAITVLVDNERTGHRMPSGSIELRYVWLDVQAVAGDKPIDIPATSLTDPAGYDVGGARPGDRASLGEAFPPGKRVYRAVFVDSEGKQTHSMIEAARKVFDNRLDTASVRTERYTWRVPPGIEGPIQLVARLNYVAYPHAFGTKLELPPAATTLVSEAQCTVAVVPAR